MQEEILNTKCLTVEASPVGDLILDDVTPEHVDDMVCEKICAGVVLGIKNMYHLCSLHC